MNPAMFIKNLKEGYDFEIYSMERNRQKGVSKKLEAIFTDIAKLIFTVTFFLKDSFTEEDEYNGVSFGNSYF